MTEEQQQIENDEFEVLYKKLRTASRRLYVVEEEIDELYARIERLEKEQKRKKEQENKDGDADTRELLERIDDLERRLVDCEEDLKKLKNKIEDLENYISKTHAIAKKIERFLDLEDVTKVEKGELWEILDIEDRRSGNGERRARYSRRRR